MSCRGLKFSTLRTNIVGRGDVLGVELQFQLLSICLQKHEKILDMGHIIRWPGQNIKFSNSTQLFR